VVSLIPDVPVIDRPGIISAWDDPKVVAAVEKADRKNLIMAGVTVDVCLAFAAMQAADVGYNVHGVLDASGALEVTIPRECRCQNGGSWITSVNWTTVASELQRNWALPTGQASGRVFHDHCHSYGLLMDSFEAVTAKAAKQAS